MNILYNHHNEPIANLSPVNDDEGEQAIYVIFNSSHKQKNVVIPCDEFQEWKRVRSYKEVTDIDAEERQATLF